MSETRQRESRVRTAGDWASPNGMVLIIVLWIVLGLVAVVLLFSDAMRMEYRASANSTASVEAQQAIEGARRYVAYVLGELSTPGVLPTIDLYETDDVPVGHAAFWIIGRADEDTHGTDAPAFGLVDEASKLNLNTATRAMIELLPNMTPDVAAAILDWRNPPNNPQPDGAQSAVYERGNPAYECKNAPFESIEELRLVKGVTLDLLYGADTNRNGILDPSEEEELGEGTAWRGLLDYVTVYTREPNRRHDGSERIDVRRQPNPALNALLEQKLDAARAAQVEETLKSHAGTINSVLEFFAIAGIKADAAGAAPGILALDDALTAHDGGSIPGRVNVNTAPLEGLICLPGIGLKYADQLIGVRRTKAPEQLASIAWVLEVLDPQSAAQAGPYVTTRSFQCSADVVAVARDLRTFRRSWMVFDATAHAPAVIYRCDHTYLGWPLGSIVPERYDTGTQSLARLTKEGR